MINSCFSLQNLDCSHYFSHLALSSIPHFSFKPFTNSPIFNSETSIFWFRFLSYSFKNSYILSLNSSEILFKLPKERVLIDSIIADNLSSSLAIFSESLQKSPHFLL